MTIRDDDRVADVRPMEHLGDVMGRAARRLQEEHGDVEGTLRAITALAVGTVPGADECGISYVIARREVEPRASSGELAHRLDLLQGEVRQGPCLDAVWHEEVVRVDDLTADGRWPRFAARAAELGVGSMMCLQLFVEGDHMGAMNLYSLRPGAFDDDGEDLARVFAAHAAVALAGAEHESNLRRSVDSRDLIGQAKGILMERHKLTAAQAFGVLAQASQEMNRKLVDVALEVTEVGAVPHRRRPEARPGR
jgi:GAF domain-containing protein